MKINKIEEELLEKGYVEWYEDDLKVAIIRIEQEAIDMVITKRPPEISYKGYFNTYDIENVSTADIEIARFEIKEEEREEIRKKSTKEAVKLMKEFLEEHSEMARNTNKVEKEIELVVARFLDIKGKIIEDERVAMEQISKYRQVVKVPNVKKVHQTLHFLERAGELRQEKLQELVPNTAKLLKNAGILGVYEEKEQELLKELTNLKEIIEK